MPIIKKLKELFDETKVSYEVYNHPLAYTAQEIAQRQHFSGNEMAKVVMLKVDGKLVMAVVTGNQKVHLPTVRASLAAYEVSLATEDEFYSKFPGCEIGAMPPFGNLFGLSVYVDPAVTKDESIYFNAGNHVQTVRIRYKDFEKLVNPQVVRLTAEKKSTQPRTQGNHRRELPRSSDVFLGISGDRSRHAEKQPEALSSTRN